MNQISRLIFILFSIILMSGCILSPSPCFHAPLEIFSVENQVNKVVVGLGQVRLNKTIMDMPISSDAQWPSALTQDVSNATKKSILNKLLKNDPYVATHVMTDPVQEQALGGHAMFTPVVNTELVEFLSRVGFLYDKFPNVSDLGTDWGHYDSFSGGKLKKVEAAKGDIYPNTQTALIELLPVNFKKDLKSSKNAMKKSMKKIMAQEGKIGTLQTKVYTGKDAKDNDLSDVEITALNEKIAALDVELEAMKVTADEKQDIFTTKLDEAVEVLKNDIQLSDEQVNLAKNIMLVSQAIKDGSQQAGLAFTIAVANLAKGSLQHIPVEEKSLLQAATLIPVEKQDLYAKRVKRFHKNVLYALPAVGIGTYYAIKQASLAEKYEDVAQIIVDAVEAKKEQEKAAAEEKRKAEKVDFAAA